MVLYLPVLFDALLGSPDWFSFRQDPAVDRTQWRRVVAGGSTPTSVRQPPVVLKVSPSKAEEGKDPPAWGGGHLGVTPPLPLRGQRSDVEVLRAVRSPL